ncbi:MAG TPA: hypothetical protein VJA19_00920 [Pseudomonas sp.]|nr:hypothetical protein [Pseudomonas sp.]
MSLLSMPLSVRESAWEYGTANGGGVTIAFLAGGGGSVTLVSPEQKDVVFHYGGLGVGIGVGAKLPRFGKINLKVKGKSVGGAGAAEAMPSYGRVFVAHGGPELSKSDFVGPCLYVEIGGGVIAGASGVAMLFGLDSILLAATLAANSNPATALGGSYLTAKLVASARGVLVMAGMNIGVQAGGGAAAYIGGVF